MNIRGINTGATALFFGQKQPKNTEQNSNISTKRSGIIASEQFRGSVILSLSDNVNKLFLQKQEELFAQIKDRQIGHIKCVDPYTIIENKDSDLEKMKTRDNLSSEDMLKWREDWKTVASRWGFRVSERMLDFYAQLQKTLRSSHNTIYDFRNMKALANRFAELRQELYDLHDESEISSDELDEQLSELDEAFEFTAEVLSRRIENREAKDLKVRKDQIDLLQSKRRLLNIQGPMKAELACGAIIIFHGDEDDIDTDRIFYSDSHMPLDYLNAVRESTRYFTEMTQKYIKENGAINSPEDEERLIDFLRNTPRLENGFTFDDFIELSSREDKVSFYNSLQKA